MEVSGVPCMNAGVGKHSYANNSLLQKTVILKGRPFLKDSIKDLLSTDFPTCITVADLGCSSGPNTLLVIYEIIETINELCKHTNYSSPELHLFLNDLPDNDFNTVYKSLPEFYKTLKKEKGDQLGHCFISGRPGSFYDRLFPSKSLHFIHSSYSVHWLSQVPKGIENNKGSIYIAKSSPPNVFEAYKEQFERDFSNFLSLRAEEILPGGRVVLTFIGRGTDDPTSKDCFALWDLLTKSLLDLVSEGLVREADVDSFNIPHYTVCEEEVERIVQKEGSFALKKLEVFETSWDPSYEVCNIDSIMFDNHQSAQNVAHALRATTELLLATHFGKSIIDRLFAKFAERVAEHLSLNNAKFVNFLICLQKM